MRKQAGWQRIKIGEASIAVSESEPIAIVRRPGGDEAIATWPDLDLGMRTPGMTVVRAPTGAWILYRPDEAQDESIAPGHPAAVHVSPDGLPSVLGRVPSTQLLGATSHGLWIRTQAASSDPDEIAAWQDDDVCILGVDGSEHRMEVDRRVAFAFDVPVYGGVLAVHTGAPLRRPLPGDTSWSYPTAYVALPPQTLPSELRTHQLPHHTIDDTASLAMLSELTPQRIDRSADDPRARWRRADLPAAVRRAAVAAVTQEFTGLDAYWRSPSGATGPLVAGMSDVRVEEHGEWPETRVEVSCRHPHFAAGRMRRTLRVFDDAGRFIPPLYASIHLMEDVDTAQLPQPETAVDGTLEF